MCLDHCTWVALRRNTFCTSPADYCVAAGVPSKAIRFGQRTGGDAIGQRAIHSRPLILLRWCSFENLPAPKDVGDFNYTRIEILNIMSRMQCFVFHAGTHQTSMSTSMRMRFLLTEMGLAHVSIYVERMPMIWKNMATCMACTLKTR